jgi:hypothetical protein
MMNRDPAGVRSNSPHRLGRKEAWHTARINHHIRYGDRPSAGLARGAVAEWERLHETPRGNGVSMFSVESLIHNQPEKPEELTLFGTIRLADCADAFCPAL